MDSRLVCQYNPIFLFQSVTSSVLCCVKSRVLSASKARLFLKDARMDKYIGFDIDCKKMWYV